MPACVSVSPLAAHPIRCGCGLPSRRGVLLGLGAALASAGVTGRARAAGKAEAMLVNCIDPRFVTSSHGFMAGRQMQDRYSQFSIAGGPIGAIHPRFAGWHAAFWDNLGITAQLHGIHQVVALTHRDCGAARLAFGDAAVASRDAETRSHIEALWAFRAEVTRRHPPLEVVTGIMALDGSVELVA